MRGGWSEPSSVCAVLASARRGSSGGAYTLKSVRAVDTSDKMIHGLKMRRNTVLLLIVASCMVKFVPVNIDHFASPFILFHLSI